MAEELSIISSNLLTNVSESEVNELINQMVEKSMFYEHLGHTGAVHESMLFRRLPQSLTHVPYTEGRCSWGRINNANNNTSAVAILAYSNLPTLLITDIQI